MYTTYAKNLKWKISVAQLYVGKKDSNKYEIILRVKSMFIVHISKI